jgi:LemA protein
MVLGTGLIIGIIILALIIIIIAIAVGYYNRFVVLENRIDNSISQIDVQLKKRADLVPSLVKVVSGYAKHEKKIMDDVTKARSALMSVKDLPSKVKAGDELQNVLGRLFALAENYPNLKANENFLHLQQELSAIEDKVAYSRQYYNDSVLELDNASEKFPGVFFFKMFGRTKKDYLKIPEAHKEMPKIEFE